MCLLENGFGAGRKVAAKCDSKVVETSAIKSFTDDCEINYDEPSISRLPYISEY